MNLIRKKFIAYIVLITLFCAINYSYAEDYPEDNEHKFTSTYYCLDQDVTPDHFEYKEVDGNIVIKNRLQEPRSYGCTGAIGVISFFVPKL